MGMMLRIAEKMTARVNASQMMAIAETPGVTEFLGGAKWATLDSGRASDHQHSAPAGLLFSDDQDRTRAYLVRGPADQDFRKVSKEGFETFIAAADASGDPVRSMSYGGLHEGSAPGLNKGELLRFSERVGGESRLEHSLYSYGGGAFSEAFLPDASLKSDSRVMGPKGLETALEDARLGMAPAMAFSR